jgi:hypothetical protein
MLRALCPTLVLLLLPLGPALAAAPADLGANAALKYWQAFATMPRFTDAEQNKLGAECLTMPLDAPTRKIVARARYALDMMQHGAALPNCDWGIGYEEGIGAMLPHGAAARMLCTLACLRARVRFEDGQPSQALDDIIAAMTLGRHISRDGVNVLLLAGYAVEDRVREVLAMYLPKLDAKQIRALKKRLDALPAAGTPAGATKFEQIFALDWLVATLKAAKDQESQLTLLGKLWDSPEKGRAFFEENGRSLAVLFKFADQTRQVYVRMAKKMELKPDQFEKEWEREVKDQAGNVVFKWIFPAINKVYLWKVRFDVRRALLAAALDVQLDGRAALKKHPDPVVGGSFDYVAFEGGFELRSKWKLDEKLRARWKLDKRFDQPVSLTIGRRGK